MASDPNARRDKALESIARELAKTNKLLGEIIRLQKVKGGIITPSEYFHPAEHEPHTVETEGSNALE